MPSADAATGRQEFLVAVEGAVVVGCIGLELAGRDALLRSFAVAPARRGTGLGRRLYEAMRARLAGRGLEAAYVLTTTIEEFCLRHGFERVDRSEVPAAIAASAEFRSLCPSSAACLRLALGRDHEA